MKLYTADHAAHQCVGHK